LDPVANAQKHGMIAEALLAGDSKRARQTTRAVIESFWNLVKEPGAAG
jgi:DNA-binding FadR family transcriptional regulator